MATGLTSNGAETAGQSWSIHPGRILKWFLVIAATIGAILLWVWFEDAERRAIASLPAPEREALYLRTRTNLETICREPPGALDTFCREQAELLSELPECDTACQDTLTRRFAEGRSAR